MKTIYITIILILFSGLNNNEIKKNKIVKKQIKRLWKIDNKNLDFKELIVSNFYSETKIYLIENSDSIIGYLADTKKNSCHVGGCENTNLKTDKTGKFEFFRFYTFLNPDFEVLKIKIYDYQATHGQEISNFFWLKQFIGLSKNKTIRYGKEIDAISGATVSAKALISEVKYIVNQKEKIIKSY